jgi:oxygen-independent coproporphyrinogen III oxidase
MVNLQDNQAFLALFESATGVSDALLQRYNLSGPRYTSYPTAPVWNEGNYTATTHTTVLASSQTTHPNRPLSIYIHIPFCESQCLFCSCNVVITKQKDQAEKYLGYLFKEIDLVARQLDSQLPVRRPVVQFHWGGGTPTYLSSDQIERLYRKLTSTFTLASNCEIALEVDPRVTTTDQLETLRRLGFNRVSMGLQDIDPTVQAAIHRIQPMSMTANMVGVCRGLAFDSVNVDLIYGLPYQTLATFTQTIDEVIALSPDRIALYNYAYVPWMSPHQKAIPEAALPNGTDKYQIFRMAIRRLLSAGYVYIGMDHFAKPTDELATAQAAGTLHRNFMGYTTRAGEAELIGLGVSAISSLAAHYSQNLKKLSTYYQALDEGTLPVWRGYALSVDDLVRKAVIQAIMCQNQVVFADIDRQFGVSCTTYFAEALATLSPLAEDGLLTFTDAGIILLPLGRIFARNVAMAFDAYLKPAATSDTPQPGFSRTL